MGLVVDLYAVDSNVIAVLLWLCFGGDVAVFVVGFCMLWIFVLCLVCVGYDVACIGLTLGVF